MPVTEPLTQENSSDDTEARVTPTPERREKRVSFNETVRRRFFQARRRDSPERVNVASPNYSPSFMQSTSSSRNKQNKRKDIVESVRRSKNCPVPTRETKLDQLRASINRYQNTPSARIQRTSNEEETRITQRQPDINSFHPNIRAEFWRTYGEIVHSPTSLAHCVSSDFQMKKGLARSVFLSYPNIKYIAQRRPRLPIGSVFAYFDFNEKRFIFNLVTKRRFFEKPTYKALADALENLKFLIQKYELDRIILPKLGCGLDKLDENKVFTIITKTFEEIPIKIYHHFSCYYGDLI